VTHGALDTAGERLFFDCALPWVANLLAEGSAGELKAGSARDASVVIRVEAEQRPFAETSWEFVARGVFRRDREVVVENACTSGFDIRLEPTAERLVFTYRWRPPARERIAARVLRSRFHLLARSVLMQYPALWAAGTRGRVPLHASACLAAGVRPLVAAAGGVGRSTVILNEAREGVRATSDNLGVGDGTTVWGLVEPARSSGGGGRRMPHGRRESALPLRVTSLAPNCIVVLERARGQRSRLAPRGMEPTSRSLAAGTYMAGELRRYWPLAAALSLATGLGPPHPPIAETAAAFAAKLPCFTLELGRARDERLAGLLDSVELAA
jgi:hypothetical protein